MVEEEMSLRKRLKKLYRFTVRQCVVLMMKLQQTLRSALLANCSMKPVTASLFDDWVALVDGTLYSACRHAGVMVFAHEEGTAREVKFWISWTSPLTGEEMTGRWPLGFGKLYRMNDPR